MLFGLLINCFWDILETRKFFDRRYSAQYVTGANGCTLLPKPNAKKSVIGTFNRDGCGFVSILLTCARLYDVIAIDHYLSNITKRLALRVI